MLYFVFLPTLAGTTVEMTKPSFQSISRRALRISKLSQIHSAMMSTTPWSACSAVEIPFTESTNTLICSSTLQASDSWCQKYSARGSKPLSIASDAGVFLLERNWWCKSSRSALMKQPSILDLRSLVSFPCSERNLRSAAR